MQNRNKKILLVIVVAIVFVIAIIWSIHQNSQSSGQSARSPVSTGATSTEMGITYTGGGTGSQKPIITILPSVSSGMSASTTVPATIPSLNRPITFPATMDPSAQVSLKAQITALEASLTKDPSIFVDWMQLATDRKIIGDYQGAAEAWVYASELSPADYVSLGNLADLYGYYIRSNSQAESYYAAAIKNGPTQEYLYFNAASFYQQVENSLPKAIAIAEQGVKANPGNQDLENLLASLQKSGQ